MTSLQYTLDGNIEPFDYLFDGKPVFRKYINLSDINELKIVKLLLHNPQTHCVKIYHIQEHGNAYIDMELLDTSKTISEHIDNIKTDISSGLDELHTLNVIYVDLKTDNVGYSNTDKVWKIFDFDGSGISNPTHTNWIIKAPCYYTYRKCIEKYHKIKLIAGSRIDDYTFPNLLIIDEIAYQEYLQELTNA